MSQFVLFKIKKRVENNNLKNRNMPNHVYCSLKFCYHDDNGEMIEKIHQTIKGEETDIDFDKIVKQPSGIQDERPYVLSNAEKDWNVENWGTKWNAYDVKLRAKDKSKMVIHFQTAWSAPMPIINKLFDLFPNVDFAFVCADDGGWFAYHITKNNGEPTIRKEWTNESGDENGIVRAAIFEALNCSY